MKRFWETCWQEHGSLHLSPRKGLVRCEREWCWDPVQFIDFDLWIALEGSGTMLVEQVEYAVTAGFTMCFTPGNWKVSACHNPSQPLHVFYCHFDLELPRGAKLPRIPPLEPVQINPDPLLWGTIRKLADTQKGSRSSALHETLLWHLLLHTERQEAGSNSSPDERVRMLIREIKENPAMAPNLDQLARRAGLSTGHFRRIFRRLTGASPLDFIIHSRIERASYYLRETRLPVQQVASVVGYADGFFFSRQFKQVTGQTPIAYRRNGECHKREIQSPEIVS